ncbi:ArdC family protein [Thalassoglobus sp.]|uniref:ArdC family protein n=1 Tax=Thalassoglobus sp. TaxID=2795869 RepID=UPI003AA85772
MRKKPRRDIYQEVTDKIIERLDQGTVPWQNPIKRGSGDGWPKNIQSGKNYRGINVFLLGMTAWEAGFSSDYWITFKQAKERGGQVKKGEKSSLIIFWKQLDKEDLETGEEIKIPVLKHYNVFNVEQCDGIDIPDAPDEKPAEPFEPLGKAEAIVSGYNERPTIREEGSRACYRPSTDEVFMPLATRFSDRESYYSTLMHELSHSTGHSKRLNRGLDTNLAPFGSPDYSKEELVAEMSAAFLCATCGISPPTIDQSASYLDHWRKQLKGDKKLIIQAAGAAQKSADWILGTQFNQSSEKADTTPTQQPVDQKPKAVTPTTAARTQLELF